MKRAALSVSLAMTFLFSCTQTDPSPLTGAFLADVPTKKEIRQFGRDYGKAPRFVMVFADWEAYIDPAVMRDILDEGAVPVVSWEPWDGPSKKGIDYDGLLRGDYDGYIADFAKRLKGAGREVILRFAHEMNGNWYPWAGPLIGAEKYIGIYRHVKKIFDREGATNVKWLFAVNWEDVPGGPANSYERYYPGDGYVDYVGIDGYNWGTTQAWSRWMTFEELFRGRYDDIARRFDKPVFIAEFASAGQGGDKARWIRDAFAAIQKMPRVAGVIVFNIDKETDWRCIPGTPAGDALKEALAGASLTER